MGVVIHGSIDEDIVKLKLPDIFEGLLPSGVQEETDPIFSSWDKSTGISISKNQIVDRGDFATQADIASLASDSDVAAAIASNNDSLVPYTGAIRDVDLGSHKLSLPSITIHNTPVNATDAATKAYVDNVVTIGTGDGGTLTMQHNNTTNKEGGGNGHWYHLSDTANAVIPNITTSGSDITPTGLSLISSGISTGKDGLAFVVLTWSSIATNTFDHYRIEYKKAAYSYYTPLTTQNNYITIEGLSPNTSYDFHIASINRYGTQSSFSTDLVVTTPSDSIAPAVVVGVSATPAIQAILLKWTHNTDIDLDSYNIYRATINNLNSSTLVANYPGYVTWTMV
jgi:hypothetical protein